MQNIKLDLLTAPGCTHCKEFEEHWESIKDNWPNVEFTNISVVDPEGQEMAQKYQIFSSPGIILNGEVWATGGFNKEKFEEKLKELSA